MTAKVGVVILYPSTGKQLYQKQIEKLILRQSIPIKNIRVATSESQIDFSIKSSKNGGADLVLVMHAGSFYSWDFVEVQAKKWEAEGCPEDFTQYGAHIFSLTKSAIYAPEKIPPFPIGLTFQSDTPKGKALPYSLEDITRSDSEFYRAIYYL